MGFIKVNDIARKRTPSRRLGKEKSVGISITPARINAAGKQLYFVRVRISEQLMKEARLLVGDYVEVHIDPDDRRCLIKRCNKETGYKLSEAGWSDKRKKHGHSGTTKTSNLKFPLIEEINFINSKMFMQECEGVGIAEEGILFDIPENLFKK